MSAPPAKLSIGVRRADRRGLAFVLGTVLIDMIGIGLIVPVAPDLIREVTGTDLSTASTLGGLLFVAYSAMQFLFGPVIGNLSDAYGRRPVLLVSVLGLGLDYAVSGLAPSIGWVLAGRLFAGLCGASYITAGAFIADVTRPEDRGRAFGLIGVAFGVGFIIGPAVGGLLGQFGHRVPFFAAALFSLANLAFGWLFLPESLPREARRPFDIRQANPLGALAALRASPALGPLAAALFLFSLAQSVYIAVWPYAVMDRYGWGEGLVGLSLACVGVAAIINQGLLVGPLVARLGERRAALLGLSTALLTSGGYALATQSWMVFALIAVGGLQGIVMPAVTALMSRDVPADRQGEVQGAIGSLQGIAAIFGPPLMTGLFSLATRPGGPVHWPGAPYGVALILTATAVPFLWVATPRHASVSVGRSPQ